MAKRKQSEREREREREREKKRREEKERESWADLIILPQHKHDYTIKNGHRCVH